MWGVLWLLTIVAMPEALVMTGAVMLFIVVSALMNTPIPTDAYVTPPEKLEVIERNSLKGVKFTADGKMTFDQSSPQNPSSSNSLQLKQPE
jgi:hypothetical protein